MEHDINFDNKILSRECLLIFFLFCQKRRRMFPHLNIKTSGKLTKNLLLKVFKFHSKSYHQKQKERKKQYFIRSELFFPKIFGILFEFKI